MGSDQLRLRIALNILQQACTQLEPMPFPKNLDKNL